MTIALNEILNNILTPGQHVEFENAANTIPAQGHRILVIGMKLAAGTKAENELALITNENLGELYFGAGSMLDQMVRAAKRVDPDTELQAIGLDEEGGGAAAAGSVEFGGTATAAGNVKLYIGGKLVDVPVAVGDGPTEIVANAVTLITADTSLPTSAADADPELTVTCKWKGESGNGIDIRVNYYQSDSLPPGITATVTPMSGGTTDPTLQTAIDALGDQQFHTVICGLTTTANLVILKDFLTERWGAMVQLEGMAFIAHTSLDGTTKAAAHAAALAFQTHNSAFLSIMEGGLSPSLPWVWAAVTGAIDAKATQIDVNRPRQTTTMPGLLPARTEVEYNRAERQLLLAAGLATHYSVQGAAIVERLVTTYTTDNNGSPDTSLQDVIVLRALSYIRFSLRVRTAQRYGQHKLARDSFVPPPGSRVARPKDIRAMIIALAVSDWVSKTIVQDLDALKEGLIVELQDDDPATGRINARLPTKIIRALRVAAFQVAFS